MNPKKTFLNFRNSLYSLVKNLPAHKVFPIVLMRLVLDGLAGINFVINGRFKHLWALLQAHISFYKNFRSMYNKREKPYFTSNYYVTKSIVWAYYINHVKIFNNLVKD
jgi:hypothetical protein